MTVPKRYRPPARDSVALLAILAVIAGVIAIVAIVIAVLSLVRLNVQVDKIERISDEDRQPTRPGTPGGDMRGVRHPNRPSHGDPMNRPMLALLGVLTVAVVCSIGLNLFLTYRTAVARRSELVRGCGRSKTDRTSIATALRAQATYLTSVLDAASVKQDVKNAARRTQRRFNASALDLESRTGRQFVCGEVYPPVPAPDGVTP